MSAPKKLFDHLNAIYLNQSPQYWESLTEAERKSYSTFMINRFLSMNMNYIEIVNALQEYYGSIGPRESYLFYSDLLPKGKLNGVSLNLLIINLFQL